MFSQKKIRPPSWIFSFSTILTLKIRSRTPKSNSEKNLWNVPSSNPKPGLHNINVHIKLCKNPLRFTKVIVLRRKYGCRGQTTVKSYWGLLISDSKPDLHNSNTHAKFGEIHWYILQLSPDNEIIDLSCANNSVKNWWKLPINNPKSDLYNINAHIKFDVNPLIFTHGILRKRNSRRVAGR